jgi:hypothetical protein
MPVEIVIYLKQKMVHLFIASSMRSVREEEDDYL